MSAVHKPFPDDGVTYCGWATGREVIDGCGEAWPCSTVRARQESRHLRAFRALASAQAAEALKEPNPDVRRGMLAVIEMLDAVVELESQAGAR